MDVKSSDAVVTFENVYRAVKELTLPLVDSVNKLSDQVTQMNSNRVTREDIDQIRHDVGQVARDIDDRTYTRQVTDLKLQQLADQIASLRSDTDHRMNSILHELSELRTVQTAMWERIFTRASSAIMLVYILVQLLPHLAGVLH